MFFLNFKNRFNFTNYVSPLLQVCCHVIYFQNRYVYLIDNLRKIEPIIVNKMA